MLHFVWQLYMVICSCINSFVTVDGVGYSLPKAGINSNNLSSNVYILEAGGLEMYQMAFLRIWPAPDFAGY